MQILEMNKRQRRAWWRQEGRDQVIEVAQGAGSVLLLFALFYTVAAILPATVMAFSGN